MADENSDEEGTAETKSESLGSDDEADEEGDDDDEEDALRRLNVRTGVAMLCFCFQHLTSSLQTPNCSCSLSTKQVWSCFAPAPTSLPKCSSMNIKQYDNEIKMT